MPSSHASSSSPVVVISDSDSDSDRDDDAAASLSMPAAERIPSTLRTQDEVEALCRKHGVPREFSARPAGDDLRASSTPPPGAVCIYAHALEAGIRLPLHAFFCEALNHFFLAPGQLAPNGWRFLVGFVALCHDAGVRPSLPVFRRFFSLFNTRGKDWYYFRYKGAAPRLFTTSQSCPTSDRDWKGGFFLLTSREPWPFPVRWGEPPLTKSNVDPVLTSEEKKSVEKLLGVHRGNAVDLRTYLRKADLAAALSSTLTSKSPPLRQPSPRSSGAKAMDPSAEKAAAVAAVVKAEKLDAEPGGAMPSMSGKKRKHEEAANGKDGLRRCEQMSTPPAAAYLCSASASAPPGFDKPPHLPVRPDAHDGDSADREAARKVLECAVNPSLERVLAAAKPSDIVAATYVAMLQLEEKLAARDAEVAALREKLEKAEAEKENVEAAAVQQFLGSAEHKRRLAEHLLEGYERGAEKMKRVALRLDPGLDAARLVLPLD